ncbi:RES family NAD+ phosphorylase [Aliterella atlantica]|uniref:RES domain protein n=1 Tax=Aliterella atlantica CENA595 TaxID=1618023 RepID=A0A0D8ZNF4_9CYAN|nr:RES family NAD+ phosphorylase [Aliterella atlantica]KJH70275.1 RES domain protein [Aliterella atlantica CENA595]
MQVWRICKQKHVDSAFSGIGGLYAQARWTPQGFKVVYTAQSLALASLEVFVHTESDRIPLVAIRAFLPENIAMTVVDVGNLPENWQSMSAYPTLQNIGKQWLQKQETPILKVPSSIIPVEFNYLLNPGHPDLQFSLEPPLEFQFDERMWKAK